MYSMKQKRCPILFFIPKLCCVLQFFPYFSGSVDSRPGRFFWHRYGCNWILYYAAADKNHRGVLCHKISSSDTAVMQDRFWQEQCWPLWPLWASATLPVSQNLATKRWIVLLSGTLFLPKSFLLCHCVRRTGFVAKYASMIFICCCVVSRPVGFILVSKESLKPAVYTTWKLWKKYCKTTLGWKTK